jgi:hypothetical protein
VHVDGEGAADTGQFQTRLLTDVISERREAQRIAAVGGNVLARAIGCSDTFHWAAWKKPLTVALDADYRSASALETKDVSVDGAANRLGRGSGISG